MGAVTVGGSHISTAPPPLLQLHGMLRIILEPLLGDVPIVGAVTMFFIRRPVSAPPPTLGLAAPAPPRHNGAGSIPPHI